MADITSLYPQAGSPYNAMEQIQKAIAMKNALGNINKMQNTSPTNGVVNNMAGGQYTPPYTQG
jgi:hypothetical protein